MKRISVYIPTHNRVDMLATALNSVWQQSLPALEVIVVDDGSSDGTAEWLAAQQELHNNLVVIRNATPQGACRARNRAIEVAQGEFLTGLDDDDKFCPDHLETLAGLFEPRWSLISPSLIEYDGELRKIRNFSSGEVSLKELLHYNKLSNQAFTLTERFREVGGFDADFPAFQDYDTWVRLVARFGTAYKASKPTYIWNTGHELQRISHVAERRLVALAAFKQKHAALLTPAHHCSLEIMRIRMAGEPFGILALMRLVRLGNWRSALALFMNRNCLGIKRCLDRWRFRT